MLPQWRRRFCLWLTGLPGSGKSTIAAELEGLLAEAGVEVQVLSLDRIRKTLTPEPLYTEEERAIVYRALVMMAQLLVTKGERNVIIDATGNREEYRALARKLIPEFAEIYVRCPLDTCMKREGSRRSHWVERDLYNTAAKGKLKGKLPGVSAPYEEPGKPEVQVESDILSPREAAERIFAYVSGRWRG